MFWCWRCGFHPLVETIATLTGLSKSRAYDLIDDYAGIPVARFDKREKQYSDKCKLPKHTPLRRQHKRYLRDRGFHADNLAERWGLCAATRATRYAGRILIPIYLDNVLISYQGRDVTGKSDNAYKACRVGDEVISHQDSLYGIDDVPGESVLVVEGVFDAWRFGPGAVATFGIDWSWPQVNLLRRFKYIHILFDPEPAAQKKAEELAVAVQTNEHDCWLHELQDERFADPAELPQDLADSFMKHIVRFEQAQKH